MIDRKLRSGALFALLAFLGCSSNAPSAPVPAAGSARAAATHTAFAVAHKHDALDAPSFVWLARSDWPAFDDAKGAASAIARAIAPTFRLDASRLASLSAPVIHDAGRGPIVARFEQRVGGIPVFRGGLSVLMSRALEPVSASGLVASRFDGAERPFAIDASSAIATAHGKLTGARVSFDAIDAQDEYVRFSAPGLSRPARAKKVLFPSKGGLEPGWYVEVSLASGRARSYVVSAVTGRVLFDNDLVRNDAYTYRVWASPDTKLPMDGPQGNAAVPHTTGRPDGQKPAPVASQLVTLQNFPFSKNDPWLPAGATTTVGNNVQAYSDVVQPNGFTPNSKDAISSSTSAGSFDYTYDTTKTAGGTPESVKAAITQMFYVTNFLHDWYYDAGFDEKSGNHQKDNYGRGGRANDPLLAETQDFSGRNNANAETPADGASPRVQMYIFSGPTTANLNVTAPAPIAGVKSVGTAGEFGKDAFDLTAPVVLAGDGSGDANDACEPLTGSYQGKIVLAHRGNCSFVQKAQRVQAAGGAGIIITNVASSNTPNSPPFLGGTASDVDIPALSLALGDGQAMEQALTNGVTVTMKRDAPHDLDGALDTAVVSHEWGHVLSNRLVADGSGLDTNQAGGLGEGWGDFSAMMVVVRPDDANVAANANWNGVYPSGSYAMSGSGSDFYFGIRRVPYSTDMTKDPLTFKHIADGNPLPSDVPISFGEDGSFNSEVHNTGEVWATMLWECYASLLRDGRFSFAEAQDRMKRYLVASLKITPPSPTLLEARDAVLAAAYANDAKDFELFWRAFAKRGAGIGASGPAKDSTDNRGVKESFDVGNDLEIVDAKLTDDVISCDHDGILDDGEIGSVTITVQNRGLGALQATTAKLSSKTAGVEFSDGGVVKFDAMKPFESKGAKIKAFVRGAPVNAPIEVDVDVTDPSLAQARTLHFVVPARFDSDEAADSSATDSVDTKGTSWVANTEDQFGTTQKWKRISEGTNQWWYVPNAGEPSDHFLTSAKFTIGGSTFGLTFRHRWSFEWSQKDNIDFDGGVVEISVDGGKTWKDLSEVGSVPYNSTLDADPRSQQPLKGRKAFGRTSPDYPKTWVTTHVDVTLADAPESVQIRFRVGTDDNTGAEGWEIDDIALSNATSTPFWSFVPHQDQCDPNGPSADAGPGKTVHPKDAVALQGSATHPKNLPLSYAWTQIAGPAVQLRGADSAALAFDAPETIDPVTLTFALRANDGALLSAASKVDVIVKRDDTPPTALEAGGGCSCRTTHARGRDLAGTLALAAIALAFARRRKRD